MTDITIEFLKAQAKDIKIELGIKHQQALDEASRRAGFQDYHHARKSILGKPHQILFGVDLKYFLDLGEEYLLSKGMNQCYEYWLKCYEVAQEELGIDSEIWRDENDWIALTARPKDVKSIKDAIDYIRSIFFHPPLFVLFDGILVDLSVYHADDYIRFGPTIDYSPDNDEEVDYFLTFLQEDFSI